MGLQNRNLNLAFGRHVHQERIIAGNILEVDDWNDIELDHRLRRNHGARGYEQQNTLWFPTLGAVIVVTEDEAGTYRANVAEGFAANNYDHFLVSRDLVDVIPSILDDFPSVPHTTVQ